MLGCAGQARRARSRLDRRRPCHDGRRTGRQPYAGGRGAFRLVLVFLTARHFDQAEETARTAAEALQSRSERRDPQATSLWGALTLQRAVIAARANDAEAAYGHLEQASQVAERLGEGRNDYNTEFGPANV